MYVRPDRGSTDIIKSEFQGILPCSGITGIDILVNPIHFSDAESIFKDKPVTFIAYAFTPKGFVKDMSVKFSKSVSYADSSILSMKTLPTYMPVCQNSKAYTLITF